MATHEQVEEGRTASNERADAEIDGRAVAQVVSGMPDHAEAKARSILSEMGIEDPKHGEWYPMRTWVSTLFAVERRLGTATLQQVGETVVGNVEWPGRTETFEHGIAAVDRAYHANLRGAVMGGYTVVESHDEGVLVRCRTPHPPKFDEAILKAIARAFPDEGVSQIRDASERHGEPEGTYFEVSWWSMGE